MIWFRVRRNTRDSPPHPTNECVQDDERTLINQAEVTDKVKSYVRKMAVVDVRAR